MHIGLQTQCLNAFKGHLLKFKNADLPVMCCVLASYETYA